MIGRIVSLSEHNMIFVRLALQELRLDCGSQVVHLKTCPPKGYHGQHTLKCDPAVACSLPLSSSYLPMIIRLSVNPNLHILRHRHLRLVSAMFSRDWVGRGRAWREPGLYLYLSFVSSSHIWPEGAEALASETLCPQGISGGTRHGS